MSGGIEIRVPSLGQSATDAELLEWLVEPGQAVAPGEVVARVVTDKTEVDVVSPAAGVLGPHRAAAGSTQPIGALLVEVLTDAPARVVASPKAKRLAAERGVPLGADGSGPDGLVVARDVPEAGEAGLWHGRRVRERTRLSPVRRASARATADAWRSAPHFVQLVDADVTRLAGLRERWRDSGGPLSKVTWTVLGVAALARALARHPQLNAAVDGDDLVLFDDVNIGVAVETDAGLVVPTIADADRRTLPDLAAAVAAAGSGTGDGVAGTATVSNLGRWGVRAGTPVLNGPESVLLFLGVVEPRAVVRDGQIVIRTMTTLSFAFDHRTTDGGGAARFAADVRDRLERPDQYL
jgi:pyruvate/2-oxoglutarate dehydrogenase complex dihydrolipoamide acyltransferase (E2) component